MSNLFKLLVASSNKHKIDELTAMVSPIGIQVITPNEVGGIPEVEETGNTFEENASLKATEIAKLKNCYVFADDSGLEVEALNWAPGIYSARYAGPNATDTDRINKLLSELEGVTDRTARFVCAIAISDPKGNVRTYRGEIYGEIINSPKGESGFGYDPVFVPSGYDQSFAEIGGIEKNRISHRANALRKAYYEFKRLSKLTN